MTVNEEAPTLSASSTPPPPHQVHILTNSIHLLQAGELGKAVTISGFGPRDSVVHVT